MDGEKQIGLPLVGDRRAAFQGNERVVGAGVDHLGVHALFDQLAEPQRDIEHKFLLQQTVGTLRTLIVPAVSRHRSRCVPP